MLAMEHIRKPLAARQALTRSEAVLQKSLDITEEADLALSKDAPKKRHRLWWCFSCLVLLKIFSDIYYLGDG
ncbi:patatin-like phospholipase family protein, partial [Escherichia coli]|nr:patatin-like phospholipase family protein [Escherichia coli]